MPFDQISTSVTIISSGLLGFQGLSLTNYSTSALSAISEGSCIEVASAFFKATADITINASSWTAISTASTAYLQCTPSGSAGTQILSAAWTATAPTFSITKQGWYLSAGSNVRVIASAYKTSPTSQNQKRLLDIGQSDRLPVGTILMFDGTGWADNVTMPGWYSCIAANAAFGAPDLVDRFIMGKVVAGVGATGGSNLHTIASGELPVHTHTLSAHTHTGPSHTHGPASGTVLIHSGGGAASTRRDGSGNIFGEESATAAGGTGATGAPSSDTSGNGGFANTAIDTKPAYYSAIFIRKCY